MEITGHHHGNGGLFSTTLDLNDLEGAVCVTNFIVDLDLLGLYLL